MSGTTIIKCNCKHEYQDSKYGPGRRVANYTAKGHARCTVCGSEHHVSDAPAPKKSKK